MPSENVTLQELKKMVDTGTNYTLIDVRQTHELVHGMIPTAKHVALPEIPNALELPPVKFEKKYGFKKPGKNENLIFYCRTGGRSHTAAVIARQKGFNAQNFVGGVYAWSAIDKNVKKY